MENIWRDYSTNNIYRISFRQNLNALIKDKKNGRLIINLNAYKFDDIFSALYISVIEKIRKEERKNKKDNIKLDLYEHMSDKDNDIINLVFHYIAGIDMHNYCTVELIMKEYYLEQMKNGIYGDFVKNNISYLKENDLKTILHFFYQKQITDNKKSQFEKALKNSFRNVVLYYDYFEEALLFFTTDKGNEYNRCKYSIISYLFKDLFLRVKVCWNCHPVIFDNYDIKISDRDDICYNDLV